MSDDFADLVQISARVKELDDYPPHLPGQDFERFLRSGDVVDAWVAQVDRAVVGQVALHGSSSDQVMALAAGQLGVERHELVVVARLLVDPSNRRAGIAGRLLAHAATAAQTMGLYPILDVVDSFTAAISLYERSGWERLGTCRVAIDGRWFVQHVYCSPCCSSEDER